MTTVTSSRIKQMSPQLIVSNLDRSIEFYAGKLGFKVEFRYEDFYSAVAKDGFSIHLKSGEPLIEERKKRRTNQDLDVIFSVDQIGELYEEIINKSVTIFQPLRQMPYGKEFYIGDPDGYIIGYLEEE